MGYYETMVFGGPLDQTQERCETEAEAMEQYERLVRRVEALPATD